MNKQEIKNLIIMGYNLNQRIGRNVLSMKEIEKLIDDEVEKYLINKNSEDKNLEE